MARKQPQPVLSILPGPAHRGSRLPLSLDLDKLPGLVIRALLPIAAKLHPWGKTSDDISQSQYATGQRSKDGGQFDLGIQRSKRTARRYFARLQSAGLLTRTQQGRQDGPKSWHLPARCELARHVYDGPAVLVDKINREFSYLSASQAKLAMHLRRRVIESGLDEIQVTGEELAQATGVSRKTIVRGLPELHEKGFIQVRGVRGHGYFLSLGGARDIFGRNHSFKAHRVERIEKEDRCLRIDTVACARVTQQPAAREQKNLEGREFQAVFNKPQAPPGPTNCPRRKNEATASQTTRLCVATDEDLEQVQLVFRALCPQVALEATLERRADISGVEHLLRKWIEFDADSGGLAEILAVIAYAVVNWERLSHRFPMGQCVSLRKIIRWRKMLTSFLDNAVSGRYERPESAEARYIEPIVRLMRMSRDELANHAAFDAPGASWPQAEVREDL